MGNPVKMGLIIRPALATDTDGIARAHVASIQSLGASVYDAEVVNDWGAPRPAEHYVRRMQAGAQLFVAVEDGRIIGFSDYRVEKGHHRTAVYVRGDAARKGVGTTLFAAAENAARLHGAREIRVDASLVAAPFYAANGFEELGGGEHELKSGRKMACVFMRKLLR